MDEVDNIIIQTLKNIGCKIDDEITSLKQFTDDLVVKATICCLENIQPNLSLPKMMASSSMSLRLRVATVVAQAIQDLGYRGDMGYQTLLYSNEVEIRRIFMFLVEHLPRDTDKVIQAVPKGEFEKVDAEIKDAIRRELELGKNRKRNLEPNHRFHSQTLLYPNSSSSEISQVLRQYWARHLPPITDQCLSHELIPSLIVEIDNNKRKKLNQPDYHKQFLEVSEYFTIPDNILDQLINDSITVSDSLITNKVDFSETQNSSCSNAENESESIENKTQNIKDELDILKNQIQTLENEINLLNTKCDQINEQRVSEQELLENAIKQLKIKSRTQKLLEDKDENLLKLEQTIENSTEKLASLAEQWNKHRAPLIEEYRTIRNKSTEHFKSRNKIEATLRTETEKLKQLESTIQNKTILCKQLQEENAKIMKNSVNNRSAYTHRIMEIIGNIRKQCAEIENILTDTKQLQKDINTLSGRLERSFVLTDEVIFRDAKQDETARKAYKLLATLHSDCSLIIQMAKQTGDVVREVRDLQEQVETEQARDIETRLVRITTDLEMIRNETKMLQSNN